MKREFLKNLKVGDQELPKEVVDAIMAENGRDIEEIKGKYGDYDTVKTQLASANTTIEGFKAMDVEGVQKAADDWKAKAEQAQLDYDAKLADLEFDGRLTAGISKAKGKNPKAIRGMLADQIEALKSSKNQEADITAALEALKKDDGYQFEDAAAPPPYAGGTGTVPPAGTNPFGFNFTGIRPANSEK